MGRITVKKITPTIRIAKKVYQAFTANFKMDQPFFTSMMTITITMDQ